MIDDYAATMELIRKMEASLPIPVRPTNATIRAIQAQGVKIARNQDLSIKAVFYLGDEGGISCDITPPDMKTPIVCSITQLRIKSNHPLAEEIRTYQMKRTKRLRQAGREPTTFTVKPRKKKRRPKR